MASELQRSSLDRARELLGPAWRFPYQLKLWEDSVPVPSIDSPAQVVEGSGLFLLINPNGSRLWRLKYRVDGSEKLLAIGAYPEVGLKHAREKRDEARKLIADGVDPSAKRQAEKLAVADTFEAIGREWMELQRQRLTSATFERNLRSLKTSSFRTLTVSPSPASRHRTCSPR